MRSIRSFLLWRLVGGTTLVLAIAGLGVGYLLDRALRTQFDDQLTNRLRGLASILFQVRDEVVFEFSEQLMPEYVAGERPAYFQLWFADGSLLERSESLGSGDLVTRTGAGAGPRHWTAPLPDGRAGRFVAERIEIHHVYPEEGPERPEPKQVLIVVASGTEELVAVRHDLLWVCAGVSLALILLTAGLSWHAVRRGLEPAGRLAGAIEGIDVDHLPAGLRAGPMPLELEPVARKTDALLRRVETALERERRTTADIAHELRTPISEVLTTSEVALRDRGDPGEERAALARVRDIAWRMGGSVATLLHLARLEMGAQAFARIEVDLGAIAADVLRPLAGPCRERRLRVDCRVAPGEHVPGDPDVLRIVVANLVGNAVHHAPAGTALRCRLDRADGSWCFVVENRTQDLRDGDLEHLTDPFWRKDRARADRGRSGLGLALSRALAERTGLELAFELQDGTFRAALRGPLAAAGGNGACAAARPAGAAERAGDAG